MTEPSDDKIELLVRSVLAAVDARLIDIRAEVQAIATDVAQRHSEVLTHIRNLEQRVEGGAGEAGHFVGGADPLAARMEQATQVLLERIEAMHQRNTMATNERFALINTALEQLNSDVLVPATMTVPMASLDGMNAPLRVGPPTGSVPIAAHAAAAEHPAPNAAAEAMPRVELDSESEPIDMTRLADLLSERLGHISLPPHHN